MPMEVNKKTSMKPLKQLFRLKSLSLLFLTSLIIFNYLAAFGNARNENVTGYHNSDYFDSSDGYVVYNFPSDNEVTFAANVDVGLEISLDSDFSDLNFKVNVLAENDLSISIQGSQYDEDFGEKSFKRNRKRYRHHWGAYLQITSNSSMELLEISTFITNEEYLNTNDQWAVYNAIDDQWDPLETSYNESEELLTVTINDPVNISYITIFESDNDSTSVFIIIISVFAVVALSLFMAFSKQEYRQYIRNRLFTEQTGVHRLSIEDVLENENRSKIIDLILDIPGIHFNEILRLTELSAGNLVWHLDILTTYKIIGKKNIGQYLVYFPYYNSNPMSNIDIKLTKSKETLQILNMIEEKPGTYGSQIAKTLSIDHKTAKYHIDKLIKAELVRIEKKGRKNLLFPVIGKLKELKIDRKNLLRGKPESEP